MNIITEMFNTIGIRDIIDITIIAIITYNVLKLIKGTRAEQLSKGILVILILTKLSEWFKLYTINWLLSNLMTWGFVAILVVFQPELRRGLEFIGRTSSIRNNMSSKNDVPEVVTELCDAVASLSRQKIGALIIIEKQTGLNEIVETGTRVDGIVSSGLLINIFIPNTPLHDGAVVIRENKVKAAACFLPLSQSKDLTKDLGTRHRAGVGISEVSDCITLIVSEETGEVSIAKAGKLYRDIAQERMSNILKKNLSKNTSEDKSFFKGGIFK